MENTWIYGPAEADDEKALYQLREVSLFYSCGFYIVEVKDEPELSQRFNNPLEAWTRFIDIIDIRVRRRIKNMLKSRGLANPQKRMKKTLYQLREVSLFYNGESYTVEVEGEPELSQEFNNPLEAWTRFVDIIDSRVRRRIGDMLESRGYSRYTGEPKNEK